MRSHSRFWERLLKLSTLKIVLAYVVVSALWIVFSDLLVFRASADPFIYSLLSIAKGWLFVAVTSLLLFWLIHRYIAERKQIEASLEDEKTQAELYLDVMGHDITNLNQIGLGYLELVLETGSIDPRDRELLEKPLEALNSSSKLIDYVHKLRLARRGSLPRYKINVARVLEELIPGYSGHPGREVRIGYSGCDCVVIADDLLEEIFISILDSAIKHSTGPLNVNIRLSGACVDGREYCHLTLEDDGPGIPDTLKKTLFLRAPAGLTQTTGGVLGLYLASTIVREYGGQIWVEDRIPGDYRKGSRFIVLLPSVAPPA